MGHHLVASIITQGFKVGDVISMAIPGADLLEVPTI